MIHKINSALALQLFYLFSSAAELMQGVGIVFAIYSITGSSTWVGILGACAYVPGVIFSLIFSHSADDSQTENKLSISNIYLVLGAILLSIFELFNINTHLHIILFLVVQSSLSVVKAFNKSYSSRIIRLFYSGKSGAKIIQRANSFGILGGLIGAGLSGIIIDHLDIIWCFTSATLLYIISLYAAKCSLRTAIPKSNFKLGESKETLEATRFTYSNSKLENQILHIVLIFSIPSSSLLPYLNTLSVPLANLVSPNASASYLSLLTLAASGGGICAGLFLSTIHVPRKYILNYSLPLVIICSSILSIIDSSIVITLFIFLYSFLATAHVLTMQVLTNQLPSVEEVARFTLLRNAWAGMSKGIASIIAGVVISVGGISFGWVMIASFLTLVVFAWFLLVKNKLLQKMTEND